MSASNGTSTAAAADGYNEFDEYDRYEAGDVDGEESLSPLEQEVLDEYALLLENLNKLAPLLDSLASNATPQILDGLRGLERMTSLVSTLLKASVYSIVLQQQMLDEET